jgi:alcohol dehydrogenase class IV
MPAGKCRVFEFATAARIVFGAGALREAVPAAAALGQRAFLVTGRRAEPGQTLAAELEGAGLAVERWPAAGEPTEAGVTAALSQARAFRADVVVALGGGSALDLGKVSAALLANGGDLLDYVEVIGRGKNLAQPSAPFVAIPTTAGTGAEVTKNAVVGVPAHQVKVSVRSPHMLPQVAIVDPELTYDLPPELTASTGLDALTQLLEPFTGLAANPLTDALCREGLRRAVSLARAYANGGDTAARADMALASLLGGLVLANARLGAVHGLAGPLGGRLPGAAHGALCARLLPFVTAANIQALRARAPEAPALARYAEAAQIVTGRAEAQASDLMAWLHALVAGFDIPPLGSYGLTSAQLPGLVPAARQANSMRGNPIALTDGEILSILEQAI